MREVAQHNTPESCWVVLNGKVYDLTSFYAEHPGGASLITKNAGKDASALFNPVHPKDIVERLLPPDVCVGILDTSTVDPEKDVVAGQPESEKPPPRGASKAAGTTTTAVADVPWKYPPLSSMLNFFDFESVAAHTMTEEGWGYYSSGADDEITLRENHTAFQRIWFKPRVLVNVKTVDMSTSILGVRSSFPLYFTATALGKLAHEDGELAISRAAAQLKSLGTELRTSSIIEADRYVRSRHFKFVTFATTRGQFRALWPFLCSIIVTHPLAEVEVWVENTSPYFLDMYGGGTPTRSTLAAFGLLKNVRFMEIPATIATPGDGRVLLEYLLSQKTFLMGVAPYVLWVPLLNTFTTLVIGNEFLNSLVYDLEEIKSPTMAILLVRVEGIVENEQNVYFFKSEVAFQEGMIKYDNTVKTCGTGFDCSASDFIRFSSTQSRLNDCQKDKLKSLVQHPVFRLCGKSCEV